MIRNVCEDDPRTVAQRRADAFDAIMAGSDVLACECGNPDCPATTVDGRTSSIVIHVITDQNSVDAVNLDAPQGRSAPAPKHQAHPWR